MMMLMIISKILLMMTVRAEMMMIKTGESAALECEGDWKYCEWRHHEKVGIDKIGINPSCLILFLLPGIFL